MQQDTELMVTLMAAMKEHGISDLNLETNKMKVYLKREKELPVENKQINCANPEPVTAAIPFPNEAKQAPQSTATSIHSPLVGIYYQANSPDAPPFVSLGKEVIKGDILCIIEAMKTMNEIKAPHAGTIIKVLGQNGKMVEHGQLLFQISPGAGT